jgi:hypothetical protein
MNIKRVLMRVSFVTVYECQKLIDRTLMTGNVADERSDGEEEEEPKKKQ